MGMRVDPLAGTAFETLRTNEGLIVRYETHQFGDDLMTLAPCSGICSPEERFAGERLSITGELLRLQIVRHHVLTICNSTCRNVCFHAFRDSPKSDAPIVTGPRMVSLIAIASVAVSPVAAFMLLRFRGLNCDHQHCR